VGAESVSCINVFCYERGEWDIERNIERAKRGIEVLRYRIEERNYVSCIY
jgi:hypothetical protein